MNTQSIPELAAADAWEHVTRLEESISPTAARALLKIKFAPTDVERMQELAARARQGALSRSEEMEIDTFERLGCVLDLLHSKARRVLNRAKAKA